MESHLVSVKNFAALRKTSVDVYMLSKAVVHVNALHKFSYEQDNQNVCMEK